MITSSPGSIAARWIGWSLPVLFLAAIGLAPMQAWACFPAENAKATSEVSELPLAPRPDEPAVVHTLGSYAVYVKPGDIIELMGRRSSPYGTGAFSDRLRSLLPLTADIDTHEVLAPLAPEMAQPGERTQRALEHIRFWKQSNQYLGYAIASLIEQGRVAVVNLSSGDTLSSVTRNKYSEICFGGRKFTTSTGELLLHTSDWIS